jgi:hypothetical protein
MIDFKKNFQKQIPAFHLRPLNFHFDFSGMKTNFDIEK